MIAEIIKVLHLPEKCLVNKKITKIFFKRNFDLTKNDRTFLDDPAIVVTIDWIASISPMNSNVPPYVTQKTTFEELQVIAVKTDSDNLERDKPKLLDLVQKFIPYHMILVVYNENGMSWNTCIKRINDNDSTKRISEDSFSTDHIPYSNQTKFQKAFYKEISFLTLDKTNLQTLYIGYIQKIVALQAADVRGDFTPQPPERTKQDIVYLAKIGQLEKEIVTLTKSATRETQLNLQVEYNLKIQHKKKEIKDLKKLISL